METRSYDCVVIGGGPAGLTAAIYLARFHLRTLVIDAGDGRCASIPRTHNHAGFPDGIPGRDLLDRMRAQARRYGAELVEGRAAALTPADGLFVVSTETENVQARTVLLATGVVNHRPPLADAQHDAALRAGRLRYCPICDGYEVTDRRVAVVGTGRRGPAEAIFLRSYTRDVTLFLRDAGDKVADDERGRLAEAGIGVVPGPIASIALTDDQIAVDAGGDRRMFDSLYAALGSDVRSDLLAPHGARMTDDGCVIVDAHQRTSIAGIYAAGDVVRGLDQISHAMGGGGVAATAIRNDLAERTPLRR